MKTAKHGGNPQGSLNRRHGTCSCHPPAWGLKKGLRRARRRLSKELIVNEVDNLENLG